MNNAESDTGRELHQLVSRLFPIHRSITGDGVRETLQILREYLPNLQMHEVPTGTKCFDWEIPSEWKVNEAYIVTPSGERICDIAENNLHLVGYSTPTNETLSLEDLLPRLHSFPDQPDAIPYVTSYYNDYWGFCISDAERAQLKAGNYKVVIDSKLFDGSLTYGELFIPGESRREVLISTYVCHPSMANDQLSGPAVASFVAKWVQQTKRRLSYRFVFAPETIGAIAFLSKNYEYLKRNVKAGFIAACLGDDRGYSMIESRKGNTLADDVAKHVLMHTSPDFRRFSYLHRGSDERQYCSPGIDLPICTISRTKFGEYPEYHTSKDDLQFVTPSGLEGGYNLLLNCIKCLESNRKFRLTVRCEPQLGKRGLYPSLSLRRNGESVRELTDVIAYCDGTETLLDIASRLERPVWNISRIVEELTAHRLLEAVDDQVD